jgi:cell division protein DivIC
VKARLFYLSIIIVGVVLSFSLARNLYSTYQNSHILTDAQTKLDSLQRENTQLRQKVADANQMDFIIREARDKLGLVKPGETVVVLQRPSEATATATLSAQPVRPVWKQWVGLFFGG